MIVNVLSRAAFAPLPTIPAYSVSNAAAFSLSQSQRALFSHLGVTVQPLGAEAARFLPAQTHSAVGRGETIAPVRRVGRGRGEQ